jgi:hypothetical protein
VQSFFEKFDEGISQKFAISKQQFNTAMIDLDFKLTEAEQETIYDDFYR